MKYLITNRRAELRRIYQAWASHNLRPKGLSALSVAFIVMVLLIPFDFICFGQVATFYLPYRLMCATVIGTIFLLGRRLPNEPDNGKITVIIYALFLLGLLVWNGTYFYFYLCGPPEHHQMVVAAVYMNIYVSQYFVQRFWRLQYLVTLTFLVGMLIGIGFFPQLRLEVSSLILWHLSVFLVCWMERRTFCSNLLIKYESLRNQFPAKMARIMCAESSTYTIREAFKPVVRPCACICLDWRAFQAYASSQPPEVVAAHIQIVHDTVLAVLAETIADESYFADWTADEIFVTVYSDSDDIDAVLRNTWTFCLTFQETIRARLTQEIGALAPVIDLGAAVGSGLVGLVGPTTMKKTTIVGAIGGIAKRLETAAKQVRDSSPKSAAPVLCLNQELFSYIEQVDPGFAAKMYPLRSEVKDLRGLTVYVYAEALTAEVTNDLPLAGNLY